MRRQPATHPPIGTLVVTALCLIAMLFVASGLPPRVALCSHEGGASHFEFLASTACDHEVEPASASTDEPGSPSPETADREGGCSHATFAVDLAPPTKRSVVLPAATATAIAPIPFAPTRPRSCVAAFARARTTGPPRPDRFLRLRRTTLLLL